MHPSGRIRGCLPEYVDDFTINSALWKLLLMEEDELWDLFGDDERAELLFRIFSHLCIGGAVNQVRSGLDCAVSLHPHAGERSMRTRLSPISPRHRMCTRILLGAAVVGCTREPDSLPCACSSVQKDAVTSAISITSHVHAVTALVGVGGPRLGRCGWRRSVACMVPSRGTQDGMRLFPNEDHPQNWLYISINPVKRHVTVWYHAWSDGW